MFIDLMKYLYETALQTFIIRQKPVLNPVI